MIMIKYADAESWEREFWERGQTGDYKSWKKAAKELREHCVQIWARNMKTNF